MKVRLVRLVSRQVRDAVRFIRHNLKAVVIWVHLQLLVILYVAYNKDVPQVQNMPPGVSNIGSLSLKPTLLVVKDDILVQRALLNNPSTKKVPLGNMDAGGGGNVGTGNNFVPANLDMGDIPPIDVREQPGMPKPKQPKEAENKPKEEEKRPEKKVIPQEFQDVKEAVPDEAKFKPVTNLASSRVLLFTYMRGGSSFLGQLFRQNPGAAYWYETTDGAYSALYGFPYLITSLDVTHFYNLTARPYPEAEKLFISEAINNMLECNFNALPTEVLVHPFLYVKGQSTFGRYGRCCGNKGGGNAQKKCKGIQPECLKEEGRKKRRCYLHGNETMVTETPDPHALQCMKDLRTVATGCQHLIKQGCNSKTLRVVKAVRIRMDIVETLLKNHPDLKIIHYMRDPRAIAVSRKKLKLLSTITKNDLETEARLLCENIVTDIKIRKKLEELYPENVLSVYYEEFARDPVTNAKRIYEHIGAELPEKVVNWLQGSTNAKRDGGLYSTFRKNSTETAISWEKHLSYGLVKKITKHCRTALELMGPEYAGLI